LTRVRKSLLRWADFGLANFVPLARPDGAQPNQGFGEKPSPFAHFRVQPREWTSILSKAINGLKPKLRAFFPGPLDGFRPLSQGEGAEAAREELRKLLNDKVSFADTPGYRQVGLVSARFAYLASPKTAVAMSGSLEVLCRREVHLMGALGWAMAVLEAQFLAEKSS
jgi:hypothetical protein